MVLTALVLVAAAAPCPWPIVEVQGSEGAECRDDPTWLRVPAQGFVRLQGPGEVAWVCLSRAELAVWVDPERPPVDVTCRSEDRALPGAESVDTSAAEEPIPVVLLGVEGAGTSRATAGLFDGLVAVELARHDALDVFSGDDAAALLARAAEQASGGCDDDDGDCLAELAGALGARLMISGEVAEADRLTVLTLTLFDSEEARVVERVRIEGRGVVGVRERLPAALSNLLIPVLGGRRREIPPAAVVRAMDDASSFVGAGIAAGSALGGAAACYGSTFLVCALVNAPAGVAAAVVAPSALACCTLPAAGAAAGVGAYLADAVLDEDPSYGRALVTGGAAALVGTAGAAAVSVSLMVGLGGGAILGDLFFPGTPQASVEAGGLALAGVCSGVAAIALLAGATAASYILAVGLFAPDEDALDRERAYEASSQAGEGLPPARPTGQRF